MCFPWQWSLSVVCFVLFCFQFYWLALFTLNNLDLKIRMVEWRNNTQASAFGRVSDLCLQRMCMFCLWSSLDLTSESYIDTVYKNRWLYFAEVTLVQGVWLILIPTTVLEEPLAILTGICLAQSIFTSIQPAWYDKTLIVLCLFHWALNVVWLIESFWGKESMQKSKTRTRTSCEAWKETIGRG